MKRVNFILILFLLISGFQAKAQHIDTISFTHNRPANQLFLGFNMDSYVQNEPLTINWGDGTVTMHSTSRDFTPQHWYAACGTYIVTIIGSPNSTFASFANSYSDRRGYESYITNIDIGKWKNLYQLQSSRSSVSRINVFDNNIPTTYDALGSITAVRAYITLSHIDSIKAITQIAPVHNPYVQPQYLKQKIIAIGDTVNLSTEAVIKGQPTIFQVYKKDTTWVRPPYLILASPNDEFILGYIPAINAVDYTKTNSSFIFHTRNTYRIKMTNPNVIVHSVWSPAEIGEVFLDVVVLPMDSLNGVNYPIIYAQICRGGRYNQNGFNETQAGIYTRQYGCDSMITLHLSYYSGMDTGRINAKICQGGRYNQNGFNETQAGTYYRTTSTVNGCDSVIALHLSYYSEVDTTNIKASICKNGRYNSNGFNETQAGIYYRTTPTVNGCDSVIKLDLTVSDVLTDTILAEICQGGVYNLNDFNENQTGTYQRITQTVEGCDSMIVLNLRVNPVQNSTMYDTISCNGSYDFFGQNLTTAGTYTHTLTNQYGCDSLIELELKINALATTQIAAFICKDTTFSFAGKDLTFSGIYYDTLQTFQGCDSIIELTLDIDTLIYDFEISTMGFLCENKQIELTAAINNVDYLWNTGETSRSIRIWEEGLYSVAVSAGQCQKFKEIEVSCPCKMRLHNLFTPNGDGLNDVYLPELTFELESFSMVIYDRWGQKVYETNTYTAWNGKINGKDATAGVYYCVIEYCNKMYPTKKCIANSSVTLVR